MDPAAPFSCLTVAGWMFVVALVTATLWSAGRSTLGWKSRQYLVSARQDNFGASLYAALFNPIRRSKGIRPLRVIPYIDEAHRGEIDLLERADRLAREVHEALKHSPVSSVRKAAFERQAREVPDNVNQALWNLARLRRLSVSIDPRSDPENQYRQAIGARSLARPSDRFGSRLATGSIPIGGRPQQPGPDRESGCQTVVP